MTSLFIGDGEFFGFLQRIEHAVGEEELGARNRLQGAAKPDAAMKRGANSSKTNIRGGALALAPSALQRRIYTGRRTWRAHWILPKHRPRPRCESPYPLTMQKSHRANAR